jgi:1-deoxyxylulose-5-phosphate synthase
VGDGVTGTSWADRGTRHFAPLGRAVSRVGLGTVRFRQGPRHERDAFAVLDAWLAAGLDLIDSAAVYGAGASERVVGAWLAGSGARDAVTILTKGAHPDMATWASRMTPDAIEADLRDSLERLRTDVVDIYMVHRDDVTVPVGEIVDALDAQVRAGRARSIGASNWTPARLEAAAVYATARGRTPLTSSSVYFGLAEAARPYTPGCVDAGDRASRWWYADRQDRWPLFAWSAQSGGFFADDFDPSSAAPEAVGAWDTAANRARRERARAMAGERGVTAAQIALAFVLGQPFRPFALCGARSPAAVEAIIGALAIELDDADRRWLETGSTAER